MPHKGRLSIKLQDNKGLPLVMNINNRLLNETGHVVSHFTTVEQDKHIEISSGILNAGIYYIRLVGKTVGEYNFTIHTSPSDQ